MMVLKPLWQGCNLKQVAHQGFQGVPRQVEVFYKKEVMHGTAWPAIVLRGAD